MQTITLPEKEELYKRLQTAINEILVIERLNDLYLRIAHMGANQTLLPSGLVLLVVQEIVAYVHSERLPPLTSALLIDEIPDMAKALTSDEGFLLGVNIQIQDIKNLMMLMAQHEEIRDTTYTLKQQTIEQPTKKWWEFWK